MRPGDLVPQHYGCLPVPGNGEAGKLGGGDGGKGGCTAKMMMTHEAEMGQMLWPAFDKLLQLGRDLGFLKVSSPLNFKALGRGLIKWGTAAPAVGKLNEGSGGLDLLHS